MAFTPISLYTTTPIKDEFQNLKVKITPTASKEELPEVIKHRLNYPALVNKAQADLVNAIKESRFEGFNHFVYYYLNDYRLTQLTPLDIEERHFYCVYLRAMREVREQQRYADVRDEVLKHEEDIIEALHVITSLTSNASFIQRSAERVSLTEFIRLTIKIPLYI